jgi:hypothetical protein
MGQWKLYNSKKRIGDMDLIMEYERKNKNSKNDKLINDFHNTKPHRI